MDHVPFRTFYDIVKGSFIESVTFAHMDATFERACFLVNTNSHVYYRMSGINTNHVYRLRRGGEEYLTEEGKKIYGQLKAGNKEQPPHFEDEVGAEQAWVHEIMEARMKSRSATSVLATMLLLSIT